MVLRIGYNCISLVQLLIFVPSCISTEFSSVIVSNRIEVESVFLGCFVSWRNIDELVNADIAKVFQTHDIVSPQFETCNTWCRTQSPGNPIILKRGNFCLCSTWDKILAKMRDITKVQSNLCDFPCPSATTNEASSGQCGGNFFYAISCTNFSTNANELDKYFDGTKYVCNVPTAVATNYHYDLKQKLISDSLQLSYTCVENNINQVSSGFHLLTYLPKNSPTACIQYCMNTGEFVDIWSLSVILPQVNDKGKPYNCYCVETSFGQKLLHQNVSSDYCQPQPQSTPSCQNCYNNSTHNSYINLYIFNTTNTINSNLKIFKNFEHLVFLDTEVDLDNGDWAISSECSYFYSYEDLEASGCAIDFDAPLINGFWTNCNHLSCMLTYISKKHVAKSVTVNYYTKLGSHNPQRQNSYILIKYKNKNTESNCTSKSINSVEGWSRLNCEFPSGLFSHAVTIEVLSDFNGNKTLDMIMVDNVTIVIEENLKQKETTTALPPRQFLISLDTVNDLKYGDWFVDPGECVYFASYKEIYKSECLDYYEKEPNPSIGGYWTNCKIVNCAINYKTTKHFAHSVTMYYYFGPTDNYFNVPYVEISYKDKGHSDWRYEWIYLLQGWHSYSFVFPIGPLRYPELKIEMMFEYTMGQLDFIMIDNITLVVSDNSEEPTTKIPVPKPSTVSPPQESHDLVLDTLDNVGKDWIVDRQCVYEGHYSDFTNCKIEVPADDHNSSGYWSNCYNPNCIITYTVPPNDRIPIGIQIRTYMKTAEWYARPTAEVTYVTPRMKFTYPFTIETGWSQTMVLPLSGLSPGCIISVNQTSKENEGFIMLDKIILKMDPKYSETTTAIPPDIPSSPETTTWIPTTCQESEKCSAKDHREINWLACPGETQKQPCPGESSGESSWTCLLIGKFESAGPSYNQCGSDWIFKLGREVDETDTVTALHASNYFQEMMSMTKNELDIKNGGFSYYGHEIKQILALECKIFLKLHHSTNLEAMNQITETSVTVTKNLLTNLGPWLELNPHDRMDTGTELIQLIESTSFELISRAITNGVKRKYTKNFNEYHEFQAMAVLTEKNELPIYYPVQQSHHDSYVELPRNWYEYFPSDQALVSYIGSQLDGKYANRIFLDIPTTEYDTTESVDKISKIINGKLMSFTFEGTRETHFNPNQINPSQINPSQIKFDGRGIRIRFKHDVKAWGNEIKNVRRKLHVESGERAQAVLNSASSCVFWNTSRLDWSTFGCSLVERDSKYTICECNHLSSFALLMDVHNYVGKDRALELLTWILCPISIICLILCIGVYSMSTVTATRSPRNIITIHLCICLLLGNILLLVFVDKHHIHLSQGFCTTFGIMMHYAFLAAFFWMGFEGYVLYKVIIVVFDDGEDRLIMQYVIAYGGTGLIVLCTSLTAIGLEDDAYDSDIFCWLSGNYIWGFMGPAGLILLGNFIMLVVSVRKAVGMANNTNTISRSSDGELKKSFFTWVQGSVGLMVLLGLTWGFGFLMLIEDSTMSNIGAYFFTVLNASQGLFLFIFHIVMNKKIRLALQRRLPTWLPKFFSQSQKSTSSSGSIPKTTTTNNSCVTTFGSTYSRRKEKIFRYIVKEKEAKMMDDFSMPQSDTSTKSKKMLKVTISTASTKYLIDSASYTPET